ncbi:MAG: 5-oxoprolinase subunit PxpB [Planctomycetaceae bacterium]
MTPSIRPLGDSAAIVKWTGADDGEIDRAVRQAIAALSHTPARESGDRFESVVPAFDSITVHYSPSRLAFREVAGIIEQAMQYAESKPPVASNRIEIPVCFDLTLAPDLVELATTHGLLPEDVIQRFCSVEYSVRMIGFSPGFPYLSGLPQELATPRRTSPRLKVPPGSVAIGGRQAGIYSQETPGGWNIIGRTPRRLFRAELSQPCLLTAGDQVQFLPIRADEFHNWRDEQ